MASDPSPGPLKELATSRARFMAELGERIVAIRQGLARIGASAELAGELNAVRRRLHALAAAAEVLHFTAASDALGRAETELASIAGATSAAPARDRVTWILDLIPSLALGAAINVGDELDGEHTRSPREPLSVLVYGDPALEAALHQPGPLHGAETHATTEIDGLLSLVTRLGPDVLLLDGDDPDVADVVPRLRQAAGPAGFPFVAVGSFESYEGMQRLVRRGVARVLPKPVDVATLQRTLRQLVPRELPAPARHNPFRAIPAGGLVDLVAAEASRAFSDRSAAALPALMLSNDDGNRALAALWSAFARIRLLATHASAGALRFPLEGPDGIIPLAPTLTRVGSDAPGSDSVGATLAGRRFVVADSDPLLLGVLSRTLQRLGASVLPARDGAQALDLVERHWPDALISDALLPHVDGFTLCRTIRDDIALGDLPVALICWKEDLLEHSRRSDQHGPDARHLDPEAFAPLAEALAKRVTLERRLERHEAVHGRIDGLSPRLLLQLGCSRTPSALLRVRAGRVAVEVAVVDGRPVHARLLDGGTPVADGAAALGPFLGMRVGRFSVEPLFEAPEAHFSGDVMTVLTPAIARARRARAWLASHGADDLERVELEPRVTALYLDEAPAAQKVALTRMLRGESPSAVLASTDGSLASDPVGLGRALLELGRRGGLLALLDRGGRDVLAPESARSAAPRAGRSRSDAPVPVMPAAMTLAEAVLQAVSASSLDPERPSARRTHPGLAPPAAPAGGSSVVATARMPSTPPPDPSLLDEPLTATRHAQRAARAASEALSSGPDSDAGATIEPDEPGRDADRDESDSAPPAALGSRIRGVMSPLLVTVAAAALAFLGMRVVMGGGLERLGVVVPRPTAFARMVIDAGEPSAPVPPPITDPTRAPELAPDTEPEPEPEPEPAVDAADAAPVALSSALDEAPAVASPAVSLSGAPPTAQAAPIEVDVATELLDPLPGPVLQPGHGVLEIDSWEPQRIYVDGVFVGNADRRMVPLQGGTYQIRLLAGEREIDRAVTIQAGRRTRLSARAKASP